MRWQTHLRGDIERKRLFAPVANRPRSITGILVTCLEVGLRLGWSPPLMRACLETLKLEQLEARMDEIADRVAHDNPLHT